VAIQPDCWLTSTTPCGRCLRCLSGALWGDSVWTPEREDEAEGAEPKGLQRNERED